MTNNYDTRISPTITLENWHGVYKVEVDHLNLIALKSRNMNDDELKTHAAQICGFDSAEAFRPDTRVEVLIALADATPAH